MSDRPEKINLSDVHSRQVDTDLLNELRELFVKAEEQKERYDFTWNGKAKAYFEAAAPTTKTLRAQPEESVNFEGSENLFITGDNLEALKLLQESYLGKIDMIYIDPPYNTGKDFVYQDNFKKTQKENDLSEGSIDEDGDRLVKNEKSNGRYHSDWLTMMYPRLKLARNLLSDSGIIFVSIDDNEQTNLKLLMDEIFGEANFMSNLIWENKEGGGKSDSKFFRNKHEYILTYSKNIRNATVNGVNIGNEERYRLKDEFFDTRGPYYLQKLGMGSIQYSKSLDYGINAPDGTIIYPADNNKGKQAVWRWGIEKYNWGRDNGYIQIKKDSNNIWTIYTKQYLNADNEGNIFKRTIQPIAVIDKFSTTQANKSLSELFEGYSLFSYSKPVELLSYLQEISTPSDGIILDFFAGSGSTAHAVMQLNAKDDGNRKFIVATLDEETPGNSEARKAGYATIDQISRERIRRAAEKIDDTSGFRALKVDSTGLKEDVFKTAGELDQVDLLQDIDNHSDNRSDYDLLYDVLVDGALEYNRPITIDTMNDEQIIKYDYLGELSGVVCYFGENLTDELTRQIAILKPLLAVFKESTFDKSAQKVNVMEQFRIISPDTKVKVI
ncbi:site-specific DNA-methyltransferase [Listeria monocytogenes]|uniref:site-specific DNA-methyltransferase n=3 Tax=Listeria monocytogenes TaxID=1639 RepID=UPI0007666773|nr:site-specific DNA-methyltransferase [Listeria monocytogenes]EAE3716060.1 site-specific DNA-methyltransferase [Listeria monocytogenes serotype 1/2c]EDO1203364.1 site-specific DNA-methyltransferase [Listeria innocua]EAA0052277.1 site-specific DNA-methyltransferase [Listeria monocytogenes]EAA0347335.1 site-specific DNA-methyltransferase [Listeria monocytogenes]EAC2439834.1 site-specific DNA-methyltransferase [Listeria monocytogenes]